MLDSTINSRPLLAYLVFGAHTYHQEAIFSIVSALAHLRATPGAALDIQVLTDDPVPYQGLPIEVHVIDAQTLQTWSGPYGYHFRAKHHALRQLLDTRETALLIDTDTLFHTSPLALFERITPGTLLCNALGPRYAHDRQSLLYVHLHKELKLRGLADDAMPLLNSGVIGLHRQDAGVLQASIALMDDLFPRAHGAYTLEEFCLAVAARGRVRVNECPDLIHHYWSRKQLFRAKVRAWLRKHSDQPLGDTALSDIANISTQVPRPPVLYRLTYKLATLGLPPLPRQFVREVFNGCYAHPNEFDQACATVWWDKARENYEHRARTALCPQQLQQWLNVPSVRWLLGAQRHDIVNHLVHMRH